MIYIAGLLGDLYVVKAPKGTEPVSIIRKAQIDVETTKVDIPHVSSYDAGGQVHAAFVLKDEDKVIIAAGDGGVHEVLLKPRLKGRQVLETGSTVFDVFWDKQTLYLAEGLDGFSVWKYNGRQKPQLMKRYPIAQGFLNERYVASNWHTTDHPVESF